VKDRLPDFPYDPTPRLDSCERCGGSSTGDLRFVIFRGSARYFGRTLCDSCTEEVLETLLATEPGAART
jgi:hypothetical protein